MFYKETLFQLLYTITLVAPVNIASQHSCFCVVSSLWTLELAIIMDSRLGHDPFGQWDISKHVASRSLINIFGLVPWVCFFLGADLGSL